MKKITRRAFVASAGVLVVAAKVGHAKAPSHPWIDGLSFLPDDLDLVR